MAEHLRRVGFDELIEAQDSAEGTLRIAIEGFAACERNLVRRSGSARIVVLDHYCRRFRKRANDGKSAVEVEQVVVREFLAVQLLCADQRAATVGASIEGCFLMRVFPVAQIDLFGQSNG